jgi:hypothetical protein
LASVPQELVTDLLEEPNGPPPFCPACAMACRSEAGIVIGVPSAFFSGLPSGPSSSPFGPNLIAGAAVAPVHVCPPLLSYVQEPELELELEPELEPDEEHVDKASEKQVCECAFAEAGAWAVSQIVTVTSAPRLR